MEKLQRGEWTERFCVAFFGWFFVGYGYDCIILFLISDEPTHIQEVMEKLEFVRSVKVETLHVLFISMMSSLCIIALFVFRYVDHIRIYTYIHIVVFERYRL